MEVLLDAADALARSSREPECPDFEVPDELCVKDVLELRDTPKGKGWFAKQDLSAGTRIMVAKPIAMVMDWQDNLAEDDEMDQEDEGDESKVNEFLVMDILDLIKQDPSLWNNQITNLFPRTEKDLGHLQAWVSNDDESFLEIEQSIAQLKRVPELAGKEQEISRRLPHIVRYNVLSVETCPELLSHPGIGGHASISGAALYYLPSFFNHSSRPNCNRFAIGDVMFFLVNRDVSCGEEICISYIEHDALCEPAFRRNEMLSMDFKETDDNVIEEDEDAPDLPVVDSDVQNELMMMNPHERLSAIDELMLQATGKKGAEDELDVDGGFSGWFECDLQNLRILKAITMEGLRRPQEALSLWKDAARFVDEKMPPLDDNLCVIYAQMAICAHGCELHADAKSFARRALEVHDRVFGGGFSFFLKRMSADLHLDFRPTTNIDTTILQLWRSS